MRTLNIVASLLGLCVLHLANAQIDHELIIYNEYATVQNFHIAEEDTLTVIFNVDPNTLSFTYSTLFRLPNGLFSPGTLRSFSAYSASISSLSASDFENADSLEFLYLSSNPIGQLGSNIFANAPGLITIDLSYCSISDISVDTFAGLSNLSYLYLYSNDIVTLPDNVFAQLPLLFSLDLGYNQITDLSFAEFNSAQLYTLWLENNQISSIAAGDLVAYSLQNLYLYGNQISKLENYVFQEAPLLFNINAGNNGMTEIEEYAFSGLSRLSYLSLYMNNLTTINPMAFLPLTGLYSLDLASNQISEISFRLFSSLQNLATLWLENNNLESLDIRKLVAMRSLFALYVFNNDLESLDLTDVGFILPSLTYIAANGNEFYCGDVADIIVNLRKFGMYPSTYPNFVPEGQMSLYEMSCYEYQPVEPIEGRSKPSVQQIQEEILKAKNSTPVKPTNAQDYIEMRLREQTASVIQDMSKAAK